MKPFEEILQEITTTANLPIPDSVLNLWKNKVDYDYSMKQKFCLHDYSQKVTKGHKGQLTKHDKAFMKSLEDNKMKYNEAMIIKLMRIYPPRYI